MSNTSLDTSLEEVNRSLLASGKPKKYHNIAIVKSYLGLLLAFGILFGFALMPLPKGLSVAGQHAIAVFLFAFVLWATQAVNLVVSSVMVLVALSMLKVGSVPQVLGGFSSTPPMIMLGAFLISGGVSESGLGKRVALMILRFLYSRSELLYASFFIISLVLSPFVPSAGGRAALLLPLGIGVLDTVGAGKGSNLSKMVMSGGIGLSQSITANLFMTGMTSTFLALGILKKATGLDVSFSMFFMAGLPLCIVPAICVYLVYRWIYPPEIIASTIELKEYISDQRALMGKVTRSEWYCLVVLLLELVCFVSNYVDAWIVALSAGALLQMPGIGFKWSKVKDAIPWQIFILFAVAISMGDLLFKTGATNWLIDNTLMAWGMDKWAWGVALAVILIMVHVTHLGIMSAGAMNAFILAPIIAFASKVGWNPISLTLLVLSNIHMAHILPISLEPSMVSLGAGYHKFTDLIRPGIVLTAIWIVLSLLCAAFWPWLKLV